MLRLRFALRRCSSSTPGLRGCSCAQLQTPRLLAKLGSSRSSTSWSSTSSKDTPRTVDELNALLKGYKQTNRSVGSSLRALQNAERAGVEPNRTSYGSLLDMCIRRPNSKNACAVAVETYDALKRRDMKLSRAEYGILVHLCSRNRPPRIKKALQIVDEMRREGVVLPVRNATSLIQACGRAEAQTTAGDISNRVQFSDNPSSQELITLEHAWLQLGLSQSSPVRRALVIFDEACARGDADTFLCNATIR